MNRLSDALKKKIKLILDIETWLSFLFSEHVKKIVYENVVGKRCRKFFQLLVKQQGRVTQ